MGARLRVLFIVTMRARELFSSLGVVLGSACGNGLDDSTTSNEDSVTASSATSSANETDGVPTGGSVDTGTSAVTWHQDIAPLVIGKCGGCHIHNGIAPFSLQSYAEAEPFAVAMLAAVERKSMPPFLADETDECEPRFGWQDDPRVTDDELDLLTTWVNAGAPEGEPGNAAPLPLPLDLTLKDSDLSLSIDTAVVVDGNKDMFLCFSLDPGFTTDTWIDGIQIVAGNPRVVHHVLVYLDPEAQSVDLVGPDGSYPCFGGPGFSNTGLLGAWAPGSIPFEMPPDTAMQVTAGARIILNVHYHPTGEAEFDSGTGIDLRVFDAALPTYVGLLLLAGNASSAGEGLQPGPNDNGAPTFVIPAGSVGHTEEMLLSPGGMIPELRIFGVSSHMHYVGTDMLISIRRNTQVIGSPDVECLLETPNWNFNWQRIYKYNAVLDDVPVAHAGDALYMRCTYDNSMANPYVVQALTEQGLDAPQDVHLGEATLDEMCLGVFAVAVKLGDVI